VEAKMFERPKYRRKISGNSIKPCPKAIKTPATLFLQPFATVTAKSGPGIMMPDKDMKITESRKT
jgi:hypothetical protein